MNLRRWPVAATATAAMLLLSLSACGGSDSNDDAGASQQTHSTSDDAPTTDGTPTSTGGSDDNGGSDGNGGDDNSDGGGDALSAATFATAVAKAQADAGSTHVEMDTTASGATVTMSGDMGGLGQGADSLAMDLSIKIPSTGNAELRIVGGNLYMKIPTLASTGKPWAKISLDDPNNPLASLLQQMLSLSDPDAVKTIYTGVRKFEDVGSETVDGVPAEHYEITVATAKALKATGLGSSATIKQALKTLPKELVSEMWLDSDNLPVKVSSAASAASSYEVHYTHWGDPVHVVPPPASQVQELNL